MNKEILRLAIPNILANLSVPLISVVDVALMGHLTDESYILAIGFGVMIFNFIYWSFGFLRMGMTGLTAQEVGKKDIDESYRLLFRGLLIALIGAVVLILGKSYLLGFSLYLIDSNTIVNQEIAIYYHIRIWAAPATIGLYAFVGWFFGQQNATLPMIITIAVNLLNAFLSYYLVVKTGMETAGVAWGTVVAQYIGLLMATIFFFGYYRKGLTNNALNNVLAAASFKRFLTVNADIVIRTMCLIFTLSFFKVMSLREGELIGAANILLLEFTTIAAYGIDGFAFAVEAISGKYFGAKDKLNFNKAVLYCFYWGLGLGCMYSIGFYFFGIDILEVLTSQQEVIFTAQDYLVWLVLFPVLSVVAFIWDGVFIGVTASKAMRNTMLFSTVLVFLPAYYVFQKYWGNHGIWLAFILFTVARGLSQSLLAKRVVYRKF